MSGLLLGESGDLRTICHRHAVIGTDETARARESVNQKLIEQSGRFSISPDPVGARDLILLHHLLTWFGRNWAWLRWVLAVGVLAFLFHHHWDGVKQLQWSQIHFGLLALGFLCCLASQILTYLRWFLLVWAQDIPFSVHDALRLGFIGYLFNYVAPGAVGGDLIKASMIAREQSERRLIAVATVFLDRVVGLVGLLVLGAVAMLWQTPVVQQREFQYVIGIFQIGSLVSLLGFVVVLLPGISRIRWLKRVVALPKIGPLLGELINSVRLYQTRWRVLVLSLVMSLISHAGLILSIYFCAMALHGRDEIPSWIAHLQIIPPAELVGVVVPLPGGTGALEEAVAHFYVIAQAPFDHGFLSAVAYRIVTIVIAILGAVWYFVARREIDEVLEDALPPNEGAEPLDPSPTMPFESVRQATAGRSNSC